MKSFNTWILFVGFLFIGTFLASCNSTTPTLPQEGTYTGFYDSQKVTATLKQVSDHEIQISLSKPFNEEWSATWNGDSVILAKPSDTETFKSSSSSSFSSGGSFSSREGSNTFQLSWSSVEIHWDEAGPDNAKLASLDLTRVLSDEMPKLETPQTYTLAQLMDHAKTHNFASVVEFQKVMIAKYNALNADLDLLPHANAGDFLNYMSTSIFTQLKSIGDFLPFILPSHWFRAAGTNDLLASEKESWTIMDLDGMNYVEEFSYATARDAEALSAISLESSQIANLRDIIRGQEKAGQVQIGTSDTLSSLINKTDLSVSSLTTIQQNESAALAQAAGFYNPQAVISVILPQDPNSPSVGHPLAVDFNTSAELAISRSVELLQLDDLLAWAKMEKDARFFDWMDPSGNSNGGIGLGLPAYIEAGQAQADEIVAQKEQSKATLLNHVQEVVSELQKNVDDYNLAIQATDIQDRRVLRQTENLKTGDSFDMNELVSGLQDQVNSQLAQIDAEYGYLLALSRFNRLLYQGAYSPTTPQP